MSSGIDAVSAATGALGHCRSERDGRRCRSDMPWPRVCAPSVKMRHQPAYQGGDASCKCKAEQECVTASRDTASRVHAYEGCAVGRAPLPWVTAAKAAAWREEQQIRRHSLDIVPSQAVAYLAYE